MTGEISYIEVGSGDAWETGRFFAELFGWTFNTMGGAGDGWFATPTVRVGLHGNDPGHGIVPYFRVINIDTAAAKVRGMGGTVEEPGTDEPGFGRFYNCLDPSGIRFGLHQPE